MIRWSYLLPRLLVIVALLAFVAYALDPMIHWGLQRGAERLLGARVELDGVHTSLAGAKIRLDRLRAADPSSPMQNMFEAEAVYLDLDAEALLLRRLVVERGHISGLRLDTERATSGAIGQPRPAEDNAFQLDPKWLAALTKGAVDYLTEDFESIQLIESADERWEGRVESLKQRVAALKRRLRQFKERYRNVNGRDPRQIAEILAQAPHEINSIRREIDLLRIEIEGLQQGAANEFAKLAAARDRDLQAWRDKIRLREYNAVQFTSHLLGPTLEQQMDDMVQWVDACESLAQRTSAPKERSFSVEEIRFGEIVDPPVWTIHELIVDGELTINGKPCEFAAIASDIAYPPARHAKPTRIRMKTSGDVNAQISGVLDYRTDKPIQHFEVLCPDLAIPAKKLGKTGTFALHSGAGRAVVHCSMTIRDGRVQGKLDYTQSDPTLTADTSDQLGGRVRESLKASLAGIKSLQATLHFEGDPRNPDWSIESDLGGQVAEAINAAAEAELNHQKSQLTAKLDAEIKERLERFNKKLEEKKQELLADLKLDENQLQNLMRSVAPNLGRIPNVPLPLKTMIR